MRLSLQRARLDPVDNDCSKRAYPTDKLKGSAHGSPGLGVKQSDHLQGSLGPACFRRAARIVIHLTRGTHCVTTKVRDHLTIAPTAGDIAYAATVLG